MRYGLGSVITACVVAALTAASHSQPRAAAPHRRTQALPPAAGTARPGKTGRGTRNTQAPPPAAGDTQPAKAKAAALLRQMRTERDDIAFTGVRVLRRYVPVDRPAPGEPGVRVHETYYRLIHADGRRWRSERLAAGADSSAVSVTMRSRTFSYTGKPGGTVWYRAALPAPRDDLDDLDLVLRNYTATLAGTEEVAGREAVRLRIRPNRPNRPSLVLSLDAQTRFRLRVQRMDADGRLVRDHAYVRIQFGVAAPAGRFTPPQGARVVKVRPRGLPVRDDVDFTVLQPVWLPEGFRETAARVSTFRVRDASGKMVPRYRVHLGYGDGVASISLFQARMKRPAGFREPHEIARYGGLWVLTAYREGLRLTLMGEIGRDDLARMLASVSRNRRASRSRRSGDAP